MKSEQQKNEEKRTYDKPGLRTIELVAEEVLGIGCKISSEVASGADICSSGACLAPDTT